MQGTSYSLLRWFSGQRTIAKIPDGLVNIGDLNPGLHTEHFRVLDRQPGLEGQRLILLICRDSHEAIKEGGYKIFAGHTIKVLRDPNVGPKQVEGTAKACILQIPDLCPRVYGLLFQPPLGSKSLNGEQQRHMGNVSNC
jgi:hypothetical protein